MHRVRSLSFPLSSSNVHLPLWTEIPIHLSWTSCQPWIVQNVSKLTLTQESQPLKSIGIFFLPLLSLPYGFTVESWPCPVPMMFVPSLCWILCVTPARASVHVSWTLGFQSTCTDAIHQHSGQEGVIPSFSITLCRSWPFPTGLGVNRMDSKTRRLCSCEFFSENLGGGGVCLDTGLGHGPQSLPSDVYTLE